MRANYCPSFTVCCFSQPAIMSPNNVFVVFAQVRILTLPVLLPVTPSAPTGRSCSTSSFSLPESRHFFTQPQTDRSGDWTDPMRWSDAPRAGRIWRVGSTTLREIGKTSTSSWSTAQSGSQPHAYTLATMCYRTCWHQKRYYKLKIRK